MLREIIWNINLCLLFSLWLQSDKRYGLLSGQRGRKLLFFVHITHTDARLKYITNSDHNLLGKRIYILWCDLKAIDDISSYALQVFHKLWGLVNGISVNFWQSLICRNIAKRHSCCEPNDTFITVTVISMFQFCLTQCTEAEIVSSLIIFQYSW